MAIPPGRPKLKTAFKNVRSIKPLSTGGPVAFTPDGSKLASCVGEEIILTEISTGSEICRFVSDDQVIHSLCITPTGTHLVVFTASFALRIYELPTIPATLKDPVRPTRTINRAHEAPVHVCKADPTSTYLASGSADGVVKVWDIRNGYVTHIFKGHGGVVSALVFIYPQDFSSVGHEQKMRLVTASVDTRIRIFDLSSSSSSGGTGKPEAVLEGHYSVPRGLAVSLDGKWLVSGGRDSVVLVWNLTMQPPVAKSNGGKAKGKDRALNPTLVKTIPTLERVEALGLLHPNEDLAGSTSNVSNLRFYTAGEKGVVRLWEMKDGSVIFTLGEEHTRATNDQEEQRQIVDAIYLPAISTIASVHADQNIILHSLSTRRLTRQLVGFNDEIVDACFLSYQEPPAAAKQDTHLALATNSSLIRVYDTHSYDARLLEGHTDVVLALDHGNNGSLLGSGSKDRSVRLWASLLPNASSSSGWGYSCVAICEGHAESVGALAFARTPGTKDGIDNATFMFTGSQDRTIKMWDLSSVPTICDEGNTNVPLHLKSLATLKAHEKDINALDVSPNDKLLASGSQDKTAKIYAIDYVSSLSGKPPRGELRLLGICKGHKRGVWSIRFSRTERILATGSGDKTVKIWSLDDFSCLKTLEGHTNSVLRVDFINSGLQILSAASDGLVKVWTIEDEECVSTLDNHEDKVWALALSKDEKTIVSGAADSVVTFWEDCTEEQEREQESKRASLVLKEQDYMNYLSMNNHQKAIQLALAMEQPGRLLALFKNIQTEGPHFQPGSVTGRAGVDQVIKSMGGSDLVKVLGYARDWNANAKTSGVAQHVIHAIIRLKSVEDIMMAFKDEISETAFAQNRENGDQAAVVTRLEDVFNALIPYTQRHLSRINRLMQDSYMVDYILGEMDDGLFDLEMDIDDTSNYTS